MIYNDAEIFPLEKSGFLLKKIAQQLVQKARLLVNGR